MNDILNRANEKFGKALTLVKSAEESAELSAAVSKLACNEGTWAGVIDEMADVEITTERLSMFYPEGQEAFEDAVYKRKAFKLKRLEGVLDA